MERYIRSTRTRRKYLTEKIREEKIGMEKLHLIFADTRERDCREKELQQNVSESEYLPCDTV